MQNHTIILGGFESAYMQKLALYFHSRLGVRTQVGISEDAREEQLSDRETVWIGSEEFIRTVRERADDPCCIVLSEEEQEDEHHIFRYQSCEKLYQKAMHRYQKECGMPTDVVARAARQKWFVFTTDHTVSSLLSFSLTCAQILSEKAGVLYLNFSECSGMEELLFLEKGTDLTDLALELQKDDSVCLDAYVRRLEQIDYIMPPVNPMILHELRAEDIRKLVQAVGQKEQYGYVVVALGNSCCGCEEFFQIAARVFHLSGKEALSRYSRQEWNDFISLCFGSREIEVEQVPIPKISIENGGTHLINEWQEGALGQVARDYLEKETGV